MPKPIKVNQLMAYRAHKVGYKQDTRGKCLICNQSFKDCPHSWIQVEEVIAHARAGIALGIFSTQKPTKP